MSGEIKITKFIKVEQNIGVFFVCSIPADELIELSQSNERKYKSDLDRYVGIQRNLDKKKVKEIINYLQSEDACFPNSIIASVDMDYFKIGDDVITIKKSLDKDPLRKPLSIIDGQHRIEGLKKGVKKFEVIVTLFLGMDLEDQAFLFSTINDKQKRLNASLVQDLNDFFTVETPEKIVHVITKKMNREATPWKDKIKILGKNIERNGLTVDGILSQYTFSKEILSLISNKDDYFRIRDLLKQSENNREILNNHFNNKERLFWEEYITGQEGKIYSCLLNYFEAISKVFSKEWVNKDYILSKTTGYIALIKFMKYLGQQKSIFDYDFQKVFESIRKSGKLKELISKNYESGAKGQRKLYDNLIEGYSFSENNN